MRADRERAVQPERGGELKLPLGSRTIMSASADTEAELMLEPARCKRSRTSFQLSRCERILHCARARANRVRMPVGRGHSHEAPKAAA
eukprot:7329051-Prymnesium_polylepis.1